MHRCAGRCNLSSRKFKSRHASRPPAELPQPSCRMHANIVRGPSNVFANNECLNIIFERFVLECFDYLFFFNNQPASVIMRELMRLAVLLAAITASIGAPASSANYDENLTLDRKEQSTHELLSSLGLKKLRIPAAHHKKRLAEQGRRHSTGDSRMYVIKLPPNMSYYSHADPAPAAARTLPLQMKSNGKPARVYHWNIPVLQKLAKNRPQARFDDDSIVDVESTPTWPKAPTDHPNALDALAYYVPAKKTSFRKYFSGNGKPKSFYVIEKNKSAAQYHKLLP